MGGKGEKVCRKKNRREGKSNKGNKGKQAKKQGREKRERKYIRKHGTRKKGKIGKKIKGGRDDRILNKRGRTEEEKKVKEGNV